MSEVKDWKQLHLEFHDVMKKVDAIVSEIVDEERRKAAENGISLMHSLFDTMILWVEKLSDENLKLEGAIKEAIRSKPVLGLRRLPKRKETVTWLYYIMGYLTSKGFKIPKVYVESFKKAFPEIPDDLVDMITTKEGE